MVLTTSAKPKDSVITESTTTAARVHDKDELQNQRALLDHLEIGKTDATGAARCETVGSQSCKWALPGKIRRLHGYELAIQ